MRLNKKHNIPFLSVCDKVDFVEMISVEEV